MLANTNDEFPPPEAFLGLAVLIIGWHLLLRLIISYSFNDDGIRIYMFGIKTTFIPREKIAWLQNVTWFQLVGRTMPDAPKAWSLFTFCMVSNYFRKPLVVKTTSNVYWILTPNKPEDACWLYADNAHERGITQVSRIRE